MGSTAVLAVPDAREKEGVKLPWWLPKVALASNVIMQLLGSLSSVSEGLVTSYFLILIVQICYLIKSLCFIHRIYLLRGLVQ